MTIPLRLRPLTPRGYRAPPVLLQVLIQGHLTDAGWTASAKWDLPYLAEVAVGSILGGVWIGASGLLCSQHQEQRAGTGLSLSTVRFYWFLADVPTYLVQGAAKLKVEQRDGAGGSYGHGRKVCCLQGVLLINQPGC